MLSLHSSRELTKTGVSLGFLAQKATDKATGSGGAETCASRTHRTGLWRFLTMPEMGQIAQ